MCRVGFLTLPPFHLPGHVFNMPHDNVKACEEVFGRLKTNHMMSPTLIQIDRANPWSACSAAIITDFLDSGHGEPSCCALALLPSSPSCPGPCRGEQDLSQGWWCRVAVMGTGSWAGQWLFSKQSEKEAGSLAAFPHQPGVPSSDICSASKALPSVTKRWSHFFFSFCLCCCWISYPQ